MFRVAICDGDRFFCDHIKKYVEQYLKSKKIEFEIDIYSSDEEFLESELQIVKYAIVFIDTSINQIKSTITTQKIRELRYDNFIVCVSAYSIILFENYRINTTKYMVNSNVIFKKNICDCLDVIFEKIDCSILKKGFRFYGCNKEKVVILDRLIYVESRLHELEFHIMDNKLELYTMRGTLNKLENELNKLGFLRVHQSFLVNIKHIKAVKKNKIILDTNLEIDVPKGRRKNVKNEFIAYKEEQ